MSQIGDDGSEEEDLDTTGLVGGVDDLELRRSIPHASQPARRKLLRMRVCALCTVSMFILAIAMVCLGLQGYFGHEPKLSLDYGWTATRFVASFDTRNVSAHAFVDLDAKHVRFDYMGTSQDETYHTTLFDLSTGCVEYRLDLHAVTGNACERIAHAPCPWILQREPISRIELLESQEHVLEERVRWQQACWMLRDARNDWPLALGTFQNTSRFLDRVNISAYASLDGDPSVSMNWEVPLATCQSSPTVHSMKFIPFWLHNSIRDRCSPTVPLDQLTQLESFLLGKWSWNNYSYPFVSNMTLDDDDMDVEKIYKYIGRDRHRRWTLDGYTIGSCFVQDLLLHSPERVNVSSSISNWCTDGPSNPQCTQLVQILRTYLACTPCDVQQSYTTFGLGQDWPTFFPIPIQQSRWTAYTLSKLDVASLAKLDTVSTIESALFF